MNRSPSRRIGASCAALVLLSLGACLVFVSAYPLPEVRNDAVGYLEIARNMASDWMRRFLRRDLLRGEKH
jgi:hypothetical protein